MDTRRATSVVFHDKRSFMGPPAKENGLLWLLSNLVKSADLYGTQLIDSLITTKRPSYCCFLWDSTGSSETIRSELISLLGRKKTIYRALGFIQVIRYRETPWPSGQSACHWCWRSRVQNTGCATFSVHSAVNGYPGKVKGGEKEEWHPTSPIPMPETGWLFNIHTSRLPLELKDNLYLPYYS